MLYVLVSFCDFLGTPLSILFAIFLNLFFFFFPLFYIFRLVYSSPYILCALCVVTCRNPMTYSQSAFQIYVNTLGEVLKFWYTKYFYSYANSLSHFTSPNILPQFWYARQCCSYLIALSTLHHNTIVLNLYIPGGVHFVCQCMRERTLVSATERKREVNLLIRTLPRKKSTYPIFQRTNSACARVFSRPNANL